MIRKFSIFNKRILIPSLISLSVLFIILIILPEGYSAFASEGLIIKFWIFITITGNPIGVGVSVIVATLILIFSTRKFLRLHHSLIIFIFISGGLGTAGYFLINYLKASFPQPRPYYEFLSENKSLPEKLEDFTKLTPAQRKLLFNQDSIFARPPKGVNPDVYKLWMSETALSFPSGHAFNSAFLGILYTCILFFTWGKRIKLLYFAPLLWMIFVCLSRIVLGLHHKEDVVFGALLGSLAALIFVYTGALNKIIFLEKDVHSKTS
jgi:membrane-associated phospholipid phosphatase